MTPSKSLLGIAAAAALAVLACNGRPIGEIRAERGARAADRSASKPLMEPTLADLEPSAEDVAPVEAAGLAVASKALGELRGAQRDVQLACTAAQDALNQAMFASDVKWADAKLRAEQALRGAYEAVSAEETENQGSFPEVKGTTPAPRGGKEER